MLFLALLLQAANPAPSAISPPPPPLHGGPEETVCPVGGERFAAWRTAMYSTYGERPDGKPYSYLSFPLPIPECPGNKLIVFDDFTPSEVAVLESLIASEEYKDLIASETTYYRAYWLATKLGRPEPQSLGLLLSAIWQVSPGAGESTVAQMSKSSLRRYQLMFVERVRRIGPGLQAKEQLWLTARAANAARQLGQFKEAEQLRARAERSLAYLPERGGWGTYLAKLKAVIARRDSGVEPLDMIPKQQIP